MTLKDRAHCATPGQEILDGIGKKAEQAMESNPVGRFPHISSVPAMMSLHYDYNRDTLANINPFLPKLFLVMVFHCNNNNPDKDTKKVN